VRVRSAASLLAAAGLVAVFAAPVAAAPASSTYQQPVVSWVQPTIIAHSDGTATVHTKYTCFGGNAGTHLFIGVKQGPEVNATDHTTSQYAQTFYSTNWNSDGPGLSLTCNGRQQNALFVVKPDPFFAFRAPGAPPLSAGTAFVQVCVFDSTNTGETDLNGFAFDYSMRKVVTD
jgi:hypothetical protein